jgi:hypothetical protein
LTRLLIIAGLAATVVATPALAGERWMVYAGGEKPSRIVVTVDETYLDAVPMAEKTYKLETLTILENAKAPDWVSSNMIIDCARQTLEEKLIQLSPRGGKLATAPDQPARPPKNAVGQALIDFACDMGPKSSAQRTAARKADNRARGWLYLGPLDTGAIGDLAWNTMWTDGTRPASKPRSDAELDREMKDLDARRKKALAEADALAGKTVEQDKASSRQTAKAQEPQARADARRKRERTEVRRTMDAWIGQPEAELLRVWGPPTATGDQDGNRMLQYYRQEARSTQASGSGGCPPGQSMQLTHGPNSPPRCAPSGSSGQSYQYTYECTVSFELQGGMIVDYFTKDRRTPNDPFTHCTHIYGRFN